MKRRIGEHPRLKSGASRSTENSPQFHSKLPSTHGLKRSGMSSSLLNNLLIILFLFAWSHSPLFAQNNNSSESTQISGAMLSEVEIDYKINLSTSMAKAVQIFNPDFTIWRRARFNLESIKNYPYKASQSPSAVFGDFNGDGIIDAVLMGHDNTDELLIAIMSKSGKEDYKVVGIWTKYGLWNSKNVPPESIAGGDFLLFLHHKGERIKSKNLNGCSERTLKTDAFGVMNFDVKDIETLFPCGNMPVIVSCRL